MESAKRTKVISMVRRFLPFYLFTFLPLSPIGAQNVPLDYSYCGYHRSESPIPSVKVSAFVTSTGGDDASLIQQAIDWVSRQKPDKKTGFRGTVLLGEGTFTISEPLRIRTSGVVLRGSGRDKTVLRKTGYDRGAAIYIEGTRDITVKDTLEVTNTTPSSIVCTITPTTLKETTALTKATAPKAASSPKGSVQGGSAALNQGMRLAICRPSTQEWIDALGCASFGGGKRMGYWAWHPGDIDLRWNRTILAVHGNEVTLDAPITCDIDSRWGGAKAVVYEHHGLVKESGIENLTLESSYDTARPMDEDHCWDGIYVAEAEDCWVRMVNFRHFAGSAVVIQKSAAQVTVEDCQSIHPVSEIGGFRRRTFFTMGEKTLFQRCYSEHGINDFAVGHTAAGPNAFVQCDSYESFGPSGAISSWAPGILFDIVNIDGNDIVFKNWELEKFGAGWSTANSTMWQSTASGLFCYSPDSLNRNHSIGCWGQIQGNGEYAEMNEHVKPYSLFQSQLEQRLGRDVSAQCRVLERNTNASSSPTIDEAVKLAEEALEPRMTLKAWIDAATFEGSVAQGTLNPFTGTDMEPRNFRSNYYAITNGWLTLNNAVLVGGKHQTPWWNGRTTDAAMAKAKPALTRFVPGQEGIGGTDRIDSVIADMRRSHTLVFSQNYGLWTDRRRDDHERIRRKNGDAWAPFYEQPFSRTGSVQGGSAALAWDGLSKYDLTKLNKWYFYRLQQFAKKTESIGMFLKNQHYFQHNILEAGAHWVDCPWRTANNINNTPFLEPVNFTGDKRIFTATLFYDTTNATLRELHRQYIRQSLDAFKNQPNVIHSIGEEFTGPLAFVQFWLDVIAEWEQENGRVLVALAVNKDVQDAILADPVRSKTVDIIDIEQWFYHNKGEYAPPGGVNMAPRQYMRKIRAGGTRFEDVYRAVSEYRTQYPDKAVVYSAQKFPEMGWAALMAGGSCAAVPISDRAFLAEVSKMTPQKPAEGVYLLAGNDSWLIDIEETGISYTPPLPDGAFVVHDIDRKSGEIGRFRSVSHEITLQKPGIYWIKKK